MLPDSFGVSMSRRGASATAEAVSVWTVPVAATVSAGAGATVSVPVRAAVAGSAAGSGGGKKMNQTIITTALRTIARIRFLLFCSSMRKPPCGSSDQRCFNDRGGQRSSGFARK